METSIQAPMHGFVREIFVKAGDAIESGDLLMELSRPEVGSDDTQPPIAKAFGF